jgi:hypothetical protein
MPDLGPMGRGGARRRTRRRMTAMNEMSKQNEPAEDSEAPIESDKLLKLARLLMDKGVITEEEFNLLFG